MIKSVHNVRYLGVIPDPNLTLKKFGNLIFHHIRNSLPTEAAKMYINAVILSYMRYCIKHLISD